MITVTQNDVDSFDELKNRFIDDIKSMSKEDALDYVSRLLIDAGILDKNGNEKEQIVTGDFFGW